MVVILVRVDNVLGLTITGQVPSPDARQLLQALMRESAGMLYQSVTKVHSSGPDTRGGGGARGISNSSGSGAASVCNVRELVGVVRTLEDKLRTVGWRFRAVMRHMVDVLAIHAVVAVDLLYRDVHSLCLAYLAREQGMEVDLDLFALVFRLQGFTARWLDVLGVARANQWKTEFVPVVMRWIDALKTKSEGWIEKSLQQDDWVPIWIGGQETLEASLGIGG